MNGLLLKVFVTCTQIEIAGQLFDVWSDDEALLKDKPAPNLYIDDDLIIFGSVVFAKADDDGGFVGLDHEEISQIARFSQEQELILWGNIIWLFSATLTA